MATSKGGSTQNFRRISDIIREPLQMHIPICGYENMPLVSLEDAIAPLRSILPKIQDYVYIAKQQCQSELPADGLTKDESASIILYSMEWEPHDQCLYYVLNSVLRAEDRREVEPWFLYLKLILTGLSRLPSVHHLIYCGVKKDLSKEYVQGNIFVWWGFSSCTSSIEILENEQFLGKTGERTVFTIDCDSGKDISRHSYNASNKEIILLLPARQFEVKSSLQSTSDLHIIQLKEIPSTIDLKIILNCICEQSNLFQIEDFIQSGELKYLNQNFKENRTFKEFIQDCLTLIMFLLKRQVNLNDFIQILTLKYQSTETIHLSLRMLLHILFLNSHKSLQRILILSLSKQNPVPFISLNILNEGYELISDIMYAWNYKKPTILSFGIGSCSGKSTLLNQLFQSKFEQTNKSIYFQETIDINFDYSFSSKQILNIADTHGEINKQFLRIIQPLFDGFLIQINQKDFNEQIEVLIKYIEILPTDKFLMIIVRDTPNDNFQEYSINNQYLSQQLELELLQKIPIYSLENISNINDSHIHSIIQDLQNEILIKIKNEIEIINDQNRILKTLKNLTKNNDYFKDFEQTNQIIKSLKKHKSPLDEDFPVYFKFQELFKLKEEKEKLFELECRLDSTSSSVQCGFIFDIFIEILKSNNLLMSLDFLRSELLNLNKNYFSLEFVWHNTILCYDYTTNDIQNLIINSYGNFISANFPFEIIDGDNFHFQHQFLTKIFEKFNPKRTLVISIIGLQGSGKSTLLNSMFGTSFNVNNKSSPKGIFGSLIKIKQFDFDYIFLIDTEGLFSNQNSEWKYHNSLVFFCLAVSNLIIVNTIDDINEQLIDLLILNLDSLKQININKPIIHFVFNQKTNSNFEIHIEKIMKDEELNKMIDINSKIFHTVPSIDSKSSSLLHTKTNFIESTQKLATKIITSSYQRSDDLFSDPLQWLNKAIHIFNTLQKYPDLIYFKDINERQQDNQIRTEIRELISKTFTSTYQDKMLRDTSELIEYEIRKYFQSTFNEHQNQFDKILENIFKKINVSDRIQNRSKQFLKEQITETCNNWCRTTLQVHNQYQKEVAVVVVVEYDDFHQLINNFIKTKEIMNENNATNEFEMMWKKRIVSIKNHFNYEEQLKQSMIFIYSRYGTFEKESLPDFSFLLDYQLFIMEVNQKENLNDIITFIQNYFIEYIPSNILEISSKNSLITNMSYLLTTFHELKYLNKQIIIDLYIESITDEDNDQKTIKNSNSGLFKKVRNIVSNKENPSKSTINENSISNFLNIIQKKILNEIKTKLDPISNILNLSKFFQNILEEIKILVHETDQIRRLIDIDLLQKIVGLINTFIKDINFELNLFNLLLSIEIKRFIHTFILIFLIIVYYNEQKDQFNQQISLLNEEKDLLLNYFLSMITLDAQCDQKEAKLLVNQIQNTIQLKLKFDVEKMIDRFIQKENLNRKKIQMICDRKFQEVEMNDEWLFRYIDTPTDIIIEEFEILWIEIENRINQQLIEIKNQWKNILIEFFNHIQLIISFLKKENSSQKYIDQVFEILNETTEQNLRDKGQCITYRLKPKGLRLFEKLPNLSQTLIDLMKNIRHNQMITTSIKNFLLFLQNIENIQSITENAYEETLVTFVAFDNDQIYNKLLDKIRGCTSKCPCCQRLCDVDHTLIKSIAGNENNRHACQNGHQLRAIAGLKLETSNEASLFQCEQIEDNKPILVRGIKKSWSEFQKDYPQWNFNSFITSDDLVKLRDKLLHVWNHIGPSLCEKYSMKFIRENTPRRPIKPFHYILLLDASKSMRGKPWQNLLDGVLQLINIHINLNSSDRITIMTFDHRVKYIYWNVDIKIIDITKIILMNEIKEFNQIFNYVNQAIQNMEPYKSSSNFIEILDFIIIFVSDGQATFSSNQLEILLTKMNQINQFWIIPLGDINMETLEQIKKQTNGTFKDFRNPNDLLIVYPEIIPY